MTAVTGMEVLTFVGTALGLVIVMSGAIAVAFTHWRRDADAELRQHNIDLTNSLTTVRDRMKAIETQEQECRQRLAVQETRTQVLSDLVTGASAVSELTTAVAFNHDEVVKRLDAIDRWLAGSRP